MYRSLSGFAATVLPDGKFISIAGTGIASKEPLRGETKERAKIP
jgi:hypothetical protein